MNLNIQNQVEDKSRALKREGEWAYPWSENKYSLICSLVLNEGQLVFMATLLQIGFDMSLMFLIYWSS